MDQQYYLHHIGIQCWQMQHSSVFPQNLNNCYCYYLGTKQAPTGAIIAEAAAEITEEAELLRSIANATKLENSGEFFTEWEIATLPPSVKVILALGSRVTEQLPQLDSKVISSHSLADLLSDNSLKAETWQAVKNAMKIM